ncbi:hypothetical protein [Xylocopilactobacillus apis]|uniref:Uncharacterized protein n=1 Tax=Xylocopilactobacillus apis TaxID=2932183 RepID=A0AAU9DCH8_9LACO|nr:hypothetical protein [Xylocopilactobacillus apis]BDR57480.1 hypothetical protein KIMC2_20420 [Xylocopilactobacillus apis]
MKANHKFKFAGVASTALLLLSPISSAFTAAAQAVNVHADGNNWDYDVDNPNLSEYDQLLQNAGPSDGSVDWYPAQRFASSKNINASLLVKQLVDLSIATNDSTSDARKILFNDTTGDNANQSYKDTYDKYNLALGFISQILAFKNARVGKVLILNKALNRLMEYKLGILILMRINSLILAKLREISSAKFRSLKTALISLTF